MKTSEMVDVATVCVIAFGCMYECVDACKHAWMHGYMHATSDLQSAEKSPNAMTQTVATSTVSLALSLNNC